MLNFFKKIDSSPNKCNNNNKNSLKLNRSSSKTSSISNCSTRAESICGDSPVTSPTATTVSVNSFDDEGLFDTDTEYAKERSRLSKTLSEVLADKSALGYFVQYLESRNALHYVRCWLDLENFRRAVQLNFKETSTSSCRNRTEDHDSLSVSSSATDVDVNSITCDSIAEDVSSKYEYVSGALDTGQLLQDFTDDALRIFKKYVALEAPDSVGCNETLRNVLVESICNGSNNKSSMKNDYFKDLHEYVYGIMERDYFAAFLGSDYFCKHQIDVLTSGNIVLDDVLYNETALFYFMEFLEQEGSRNLLEFWLAASNLQQQLEQQKEFYDPVEAQNDAVVLYDKYFSLQAHYPLGFGDKIRFAVEQNICGEDGLMINCFEHPLKLVEQKLQHNYLRQFVNSQLFYKYLSELINTVQSSGYSTLYDRQKQPSDCSSERSFCTNSTFLAMEVPRNKNNVKSNKGAGDMNIETKHLYDPDSLWKRKKYRRLTFGHVTELGKFIRDSEPDPDKNGSFKLRDVVRKFVKFDEDKHKEEMAWQVAEMIVKDITSVTLSEQKT